MPKRIALVVIALVTLCAAASTAVGQATDPWLGTWKVNLAKSTYRPGPKFAGTVTVEPWQDGFRTIIDGANAGANGQSQPIHTEASWKFDSKDNPVQGAPAPNSTVNYKRIDGRTLETVGKTDGKVTVTTKVAISANGKTMTASQKGKNPQGQTVNNVIVLDKQ